MHPTIDLLEFANALSVPDVVRCHPVLDELRKCTIYVAAMMNDLFSYHKETILPNQRFNLP
jgi:hypothetical protein